MSEHTNGSAKFILYETSHDGTIARITLNRPETRNAQTARSCWSSTTPSSGQKRTTTCAW